MEVACMLPDIWKCAHIHHLFSCICIKHCLLSKPLFKKSYLVPQWQITTGPKLAFLKNILKKMFVGCPGSTAQRLCPRCSGPRFNSTLWLLAVCYSLTLSSISCSVLQLFNSSWAKQFFLMLLSLNFDHSSESALVGDLITRPLRSSGMKTKQDDAAFKCSSLME